MTEPIPGAPGLPILGNSNDIDPLDATASLCRLAETYGPIFKATLGGCEKVFISTHELLDEVCDEKRFTKMVFGSLEQIRNGIHDGLFTAYPGEHNWEVAHRVLMPAFGPLSIRSMFDEMQDIASQLVVKWARFGPKEKINVPEDFTRLTLDSIALCAMDTRFNSFYHDDMHPFIDAMVGLLQESGARAARPAVANYFYRSAQKKYDSDIVLLRKVAAEVVAERKANPNDKTDLLNAMIKGHETTSGLLSFLFYDLLKSPSAYQTARRQVDEVVGRGPITADHILKLPYIEACLRETLRLRPTAPVFTVQTLPDSPGEFATLSSKYQVKKGLPIIALLRSIHRDPAVFGADAEIFKPERMLDEPFSMLPKNSWKPFGNGMRGCTGRPFAWQEAILTTAMLLQSFDFRLNDPSYTLQIKQTLTIKPKNFFIHASLREHIDSAYIEKMLHVDASKASSGHDKARNNHTAAISSSYEGQPPDNAAHIFEWLQNLDCSSRLRGVKYAVFGCGNHDWVSTLHRIPKLLNSRFEYHGATQVAKIGQGDVGAGDIFNDFDKWQDEQLWSALGGDVEAEEELGMEIEIDTGSRRSKLRQDVKEAVVISNRVLTKNGEPEKRHIVLNLPTGMTYKTGDYLAVLPMNNSKNVRRVLKWAHLPWDTMLTIKTSCPDETVRASISALAGKDFEQEVLKKRRSPLDILEQYSGAALPLGDFLAMLPPMRIRQDSISSSPLADLTTATITWSVLDTPSKAAGSRRFLGIASNYLSSVEEERAIQIQAGRKLAPAYLFIGCAHPQKDTLFSDELSQWEKDGVLKLFYAFSKSSSESKGEEIVKVFHEGASLYVCGGSMVGEGVANTVKRIY
ncbi:P450 family fatty acid hydroxylase [Rhexocercosporidium sp. MPI-PUGE-AT-0058]|nr:P450 family fatty acid hydroxylase [Rhexocercosporidium sp. MPI-PUGE-AT-0058]